MRAMLSLAALSQRLAPTLTEIALREREGTLAAPVDLAAMGDDFELRASLAGDVTVAGGALVVEGDADVGVLTVRAPLVVMGSVRAERVELSSSMLVVGGLAAGDVRGTGEPHTLTVMGAVHVGRAAMARQFVMQFLGGGRVDVMLDEDGGADELVAILGGGLVVGETGTLRDATS